MSQTIKIGVISDLHKRSGRVKKVCDMLLESGCEYFICAGDIVLRENLDILKQTNKPYVCVFGNNDYELFGIDGYNIFKEPHYFKIKETKFKLMHHPFYMSADSDIVIFGHTHYFEVDFKNGVLFLNPGEVCARNKDTSECVMLEITSDKYKVTYFNRTIKTTKWNEKSIEFERN